MAAQGQDNLFITNIHDFLEEKIWSQEEKVTPEPWLKLKKIKSKAKYQKIFKISKFEERAKNRFHTHLKKTKQIK